ncbi:MAG: hypothetical protein ACXVEF_37020 [Polyangiales bacterium]
MAGPSDIPCASCGTPLPYGARFCNVCGAAQPAPAPPQQPAPQPRPKFGAATVVGVASPLAPQSQQPAWSPPQPQAPQAPAPQPAPPQHYPQPTAQSPAAKKGLAGTMIGVAVPDIPKPAPQQPQQQARNVPKGTLVGVALPGVAPTHDKPPAPPGWTPPAGRPPGSSQPPPPQPNYQLPPGSPYAQQQPSPAFVPPPAWQGPAPEEEALPPAKKPSRAPVFALLGLAVVGVAVALFLVLRPSGAPQLTSQVKGEAGAPKLVVGCESCADGSSFQLGDKSADFANHEASIALAASSLKAGKNVLKGAVTPKGKKPIDVELEVSIPYLAQTSLASLEKGQVDLIFDLAPDAKGVEVDGKTVEGSGKKTVPIAIPPATDETRTFERTVKFKVLAAKPIEGALKLAIPYAPLRVGLPGKRAIAFGDTIEVSGRTAPNATVTIGETSFTADAQGIFKGTAPVAKDATTLVMRALSSKLAPREVTVQIAHAGSVDDAVKALRAEAKLPFDKIAAEPDKHVGEVAAAKIEIAQVGDEDGRPVAVGETKCPAAAQGNTCPVVRILLPPGASATKGKVVEVLGTVTRAVPLEKGNAVEIDGAVLLESK